MTPTDAQQQQLLEQLRQAGDEALAFAKLPAAEITDPAPALLNKCCAVIPRLGT